MIIMRRRQYGDQKRKNVVAITAANIHEHVFKELLNIYDIFS